MARFQPRPPTRGKSVILSAPFARRISNPASRLPTRLSAQTRHPSWPAKAGQPAASRRSERSLFAFSLGSTPLGAFRGCHSQPRLRALHHGFAGSPFTSNTVPYADCPAGTVPSADAAPNSVPSLA